MSIFNTAIHYKTTISRQLYCWGYCLLVCILGVNNAKAQDIASNHFTEEQGLPGNTFYKILQDKQGYLWLAGDEGLYRWDGLHFKHFHHPQQQRKSMAYVCLDNQGNIWASNFSGQIYKVCTDSLQAIKTPYKIGTGLCKRIDIINTQNMLICMDKHQFFWLKDGQWQNLTLNDNTYGRVFLNPEGYIVAASDQTQNLSIHHINTAYDQTYTLKMAQGGEAECLYDTWNNETVFVKQFLSGDAIFWYHQNNWTSLPVKHKPSLVQAFKADPAHNCFWILAPDGAYQYNIQGELMKHWFSNESISDLLIDREGCYWFTTLGTGIIQVKNPDIIHYNTQNSSFKENDLFRLNAIDEQTLVLTFRKNHIALFNTLGSAMQQIALDGGRENYGTLGLNGSNNLLVFGNNLHHYQNGVVTNLGNSASIKDALLINNHQILMATSGSLELNTTNNLNLHTKQSLSKSSLALSAELPAVAIQYSPYQYSWQLRPQRAWSLAHANDNNSVWIAFADDLWLWNYKTNTSQIIKQTNGQSIVAHDLYVADDGSVWAAGQEALYRIQNQQVVKQFALPCYRVFAKGNKAWVTCNDGLRQIEWHNNDYKIYHLDKSFGLPTTGLSDIYVSQDKIYLGSNKGLFIMPIPQALDNYMTKPLIYINQVALFEKKLDIALNQSAELSYKDNNLRFDFCGFAWRAPDKLQYRYRLIGLDTAWTQIEGTQQSVRYPALPSGHYQFEVMAINESGLSSDIASFSFCIKPAFWQTWWFILACLLLMGGIVSVYYRWRIKHIQQRNVLEQENASLALANSQIEEQLQESQLASLKAQMNPHFIFNALNSLQSYIIDNEPMKANIYLADFAQLMRLTLEMSNEATISLKDELQMLKLYLDLEGIRFEDSFSYSLEVAPDINPELIPIPSMLIQPYIENAIKHGLLHIKNNRRLSINFSIMPNESSVLRCIIEDNGIGRKRSEELKRLRNAGEHKSFATGATRGRLDILNKRRNKPLSVVYEDLHKPDGSKGTRVTLYIPFDEFNY